MMRVSPLSAMLLAAAFPTAAFAQNRLDVQAGAEFRTVSYGAGLGYSSLKEFAVPVGFAMPIGSRLNLDAGSYYVSAQLTDASGSQQTISGLTDVIIRGNYQLKPDVAVFTFAMSLPTGQKTLSGSQRQIASAMATDLVPFPVTNFGTGFSATTGLALATPVGPWALGLAGSFRYNASYRAVADTSLTLKPGAEMRVRLGADRIIGQGRLSFGLTYSSFANDEFGSQSQSPGTRFIPQFSWSTPLGVNNSLVLYGWDVYRSVDESAQVNAGVSQNTVAIGAMAAMRSGRNTLRPQLELRKAWQGPGSLHNQGMLVGLALRYQIATGERMTVTPGARFDLGSLATSQGSPDASFTGLSVSLTARTSF